MPRISVICQTVMASGFNMYSLLVITTLLSLLNFIVISYYSITFLLLSVRFLLLGYKLARLIWQVNSEIRNKEF